MPKPRSSPSVASSEAPPTGRVQRICTRCQQRLSRGKPLNCSECEKTIQRMERSLESPAVDSSLSRRINSLRGGGEPLPGEVRAFFEPRFGRDFNDVRVHTGPRANEAARSINATAFTLGRDIAFRSGAYRPETTRGRRLLAHELTHVTQQTSPRGPAWIQRECVNGRWRYEYDGCSVPPQVASALGAAHKDNPAGGVDTQFARPDSSRDRPCDRHDECYQTCHNNLAAKRACDRQMYADMMSVCENSQASETVKAECRKYAQIYYNGLIGLAKGAFLERQAAVCACEGESGPSPGLPGGIDVDIPLGWTVPLGENAELRAGVGLFRPMGPDGGGISVGPAAGLTWRF